MDAVLEFFAGYSWQELITFLFAGVLGFAPGFNIFQWLKFKWQLEGQQAQMLVMGGSVLITVLAMLATGALSAKMFEFTLENLMAMGTMVYVGSQVAYQRFKG